MQAILLGRSETSKVSILRAPLWPSRMRFQVVSTPQPSGDTMPRPVTTTRLMSSTPTRGQRPTMQNRSTAWKRSVRFQRRAGGSALCVLLEKFRGVPDGQNRLRGVVGNLATKLFFKCHHELDGVEAVGAEVVNEARVVDHFFGLNTKVFDHDLLNPLANLTHRSTSCCFLDPTPGIDIVVDKLPSQPRINLIWPRCQRPMIEVSEPSWQVIAGTSKGRQPKRPANGRQAPSRQYTGFPNPAMAIL